MAMFCERVVQGHKFAMQNSVRGFLNRRFKQRFWVLLPLWAKVPRGRSHETSLLRLQSHRQNHIQKAVAAVGRGDDAGGNIGVQGKAHRVRRGVPQGFHKIAVIEADLKARAVALCGADILGLAVAGSFNPLFIYGDSGLGKTHLLHAIARQTRRLRPESSIVLVKGVDFTNELIEAIRGGTTSEFRDKYQKESLLLVDDIQFIAGKQQTQEEFFHTFNALYESGKQIVLTSDRPPKEMTQLEDRLRTRFEWGLMVDVEPPDYETRLAIIRNKAALLGINLPDRISSMIAENITANVRQIEGVLNKILAYSDLMGVMDEEAIMKALEDVVKNSNEYIPTPESIIEYISKYFGIEPDVLQGQSRSRDITNARQIAMYLIRRMTNLSLKDIGKALGNRDHSTVMHSLEKVEAQMRSDPAFAETVKEITTNINAKQ